MSKQNNLSDFLEDLADTIRAKKQMTGKINPQNFSQEIDSIQTQTSSATIVTNIKNDIY